MITCCAASNSVSRNIRGIAARRTSWTRSKSWTTHSNTRASSERVAAMVPPFAHVSRHCERPVIGPIGVNGICNKVRARKNLRTHDMSQVQHPSSRWVVWKH
eukprot:801850-Amphidinium_carterae.1